MGTEAPGLAGVWRLRETRLRYGPEAPLPAGTLARPFVGFWYAQLGPYRSAPIPRRNETWDFGTPPTCGYRGRTKRRGPVRRGEWSRSGASMRYLRVPKRRGSLGSGACEKCDFGTGPKRACLQVP